MRDPLREFLPLDEDYQDAFDRFEYLLGLVHADLTHWEQEKGGCWRPVGCSVCRYGRFRHEGQPSEKIGAEIDVEAASWPLLKAGLFGGSLEQLKDSKAQ